MKKTRLLMLVGVLLLSLMLVGMALAADSAQKPAPTAVGTTSTGIAPETGGGGIDSLSGSFVVFDPSVGGDVCFSGGETQTFCFRAESYTNDWEYVYDIFQKFATDWTVTNVYVQGTPVCDSGTWGTFSWSYVNDYEIDIYHSRYQSPTDHCVAYYCFEVVSGASDGNASWYWTGDGYGSTPHHPCSDDGYTPSGWAACDQAVEPPAFILPCEPGIYLSPESQSGSACEGESVVYTLNLFNNSGDDGTFDLTYDSMFPIDGPESLEVLDGETAPFDVEVTIPCGGTSDTATITADGNGFSDSATVTTEISAGGWVDEPASPVVAMDNPAISYDGKLYVVDGYGSGGAVQIFDGASWTTGATGGYNGYVVDACLGLNDAGDPVIDLFGDTTTFFSLERYDINGNSWTYPAFPPDFPATGLWAPDIVSMLQHTGENVCYISGGATTPGGGNTSALYAYYPDTMTVVDLGDFTYLSGGFDFHFSWYVPWVGAEGAICVAGGVNAAGAYSGDTQCFDLETGVFNAVNADLGTLPQPWWGGGDAWMENDGNYELWGVNGVDAAGALLQKSFFWNGSAFEYGPDPLYGVYRMEADNFEGSIWAANGSTGGFTPSTLEEYLLFCPECGAPIIGVDPMSLTQDLFQDYQTADQILTVCNDISGTLPLDWELIEAEAAPPFAGSMPFVPVSTAASNGDFTGLTASSGNTALGIPAPAANPQDVLWDQPLSAIDQNAFVDQDFPDVPDYSSFLADDFSTGADDWLIEKIFIPADGWNGFTTLMNADSLTWQIYADCTGVPCGDPSGGGDAPVWTLTLLPTDPQVVITNGTPGNFASNTELTLDTPIVVPAGDYWLVFYPTMAFSPYGQFGRQASDTTNGNMSQFINPGGGFGLGTEWQDWTVIGATLQDMAFRLEGMIAVPYDIPWLSEEPLAGTLDPGVCQPITVTFDSLDLALGEYSDLLKVLSNDPVTPEVVVPVTLNVVGQADLELAKMASAEEVRVNDLITYTLVVSNNGPDVAMNVMVEDTLPAEVMFASSPDCTEDMGLVMCQVDELDTGMITFTVVVTATDAGTAVNMAEVTSDTADPDPENNMAEVSTLIKPAFFDFYLPIVQKH